MASIIASDLITKSMKLIGAIASNELPTPEELNDGLDILNDMLELWSIEGLSVWASTNQSFNVQAGVSTYTIGPGGVFNTTRPPAIIEAYCTVNAVDYPVRVIDQSAYNKITYKTFTQQILEKLLYVNENPLGMLYIWPVPLSVVPLTLSIGRVLSAIPTLATVISYPPGYSMALRYNLAVAMCSGFGRTPPADVLGIAKDTKGTIKISNMTAVPQASFDTVLSSRNRGNWITGE